MKDDIRVYADNRKILIELRKREHAGEITRQQLLTLRGQVMAGDADGAYKGLARILREKAGL